MKNKKNHRIATLLLPLLLLVTLTLKAQNRLDTIQRKLNAICNASPGLLNNIDISVNGVTLEEFLRGIAANNDLNITITGNSGITLVTNFKNARVMDVLLYLCRNYSLNIETTGNIITVSKYTPEPEPKKTQPPKVPLIKYDAALQMLSFDLRSDSLVYVCRRLTELSGSNFIYPPELRGKLMNGYLEKVPFGDGLAKIASLNNLSFSASTDGFFYFEALPDAEKKDKMPGDKTQKPHEKPVDGLQAKATASGQLDISAINVSLEDVIKTAAAELGINYFLLNDMKEKVSLNMTAASFDELLNALLLGTNYSYRPDSNTYILGKRDMEGLRHCPIIQLRHRTVNEITKIIPEALKQKVSITEFPDINSLIICGAEPDTKALRLFLLDMDKTVPQVMIEVLIVDRQTSHNVKTGIKAGIGDAPAKTSGELFPEFNMTLGSDIINSLINSFNGFGIINLGKVTPDFYVSLSAMENNGLINIRSTPKLATMNGTEAKMTIGTTEYYLEETNNVIGTQNPQNIITKVYKSVDAEFSLTIKPMVQGDDQITLEIGVGQSDFTGRISAGAPPGKVSRNFNSTVRIKDREMILLGGLEEKKNDDAGDGVPLLSRIPIIKWLFSSKNKSRSSKKLNIFIRPTIIY